MFSATKFAEWLIQQGLIRSEQYCLQCSKYKNLPKTKLKLGMYSDQGTFPYSGGYVWISTCCQEKYVSCFSGSIFQGAPYTPTVLLKLIYHWACQTNVQNVVSWVKVSNIYLKNFYTNLRSICTAVVWDKTYKMGGKNSMIQVGVISLGTTSQDGEKRQVKYFNPLALYYIQVHVYTEKRGDNFLSLSDLGESRGSRCFGFLYIRFTIACV